MDIIPTTIVWLRLDLRLTDHPALTAAIERGVVTTVFIWTPEDEKRWPLGGASRWWLHQSLSNLNNVLRSRGSRLIIRIGATVSTLCDLVQESGATAVYYSRRYEPAAVQMEQQVEQALAEKGIEATGHPGTLLFDPAAIRTKTGQPYQVFSPFWRRCLQETEPAEPLPAPKNIPAPTRWPKSAKLADLALEPTIDWAGEIRATWQPGEAGAQQLLDRFVSEALIEYDTDRDRPDRDGTSRLSPHLHFGEISPRQVWAALHKRASAARFSQGRERYLSEIGWREFAHHLLVHFPHTPVQPLREEFSRFPWDDDQKLLRAWQRGLTGYPIVDAGMRQLWKTGWMHNRVRMIVASFLTKDLLISWQRGAEWFWDTLADADLANNTLGWQWTAGCGADAAPYFRVFNPVSQGERFDPDGTYIRRWVPELAEVPNEWIHQPWEAPPLLLNAAGVQLGWDYPRPIVDHAKARTKALEAYGGMRGG